MSIPEEAIEAAARINDPSTWEFLDLHHDEESTGWHRMRGSSLTEARHILEAAAPLIAAQALREVAESLEAESPFHGYDDTLAHWRIAGRWARIIRSRAQAIEEQK